MRLNTSEGRPLELSLKGYNGSMRGERNKTHKINIKLSMIQYISLSSLPLKQIGYFILPNEPRVKSTGHSPKGP